MAPDNSRPNKTCTPEWIVLGNLRKEETTTYHNCKEVFEEIFIWETYFSKWYVDNPSFICTVFNFPLLKFLYSLQARRKSVELVQTLRSATFLRVGIIVRQGSFQSFITVLLWSWIFIMCKCVISSLPTTHSRIEVQYKIS